MRIAICEDREEDALSLCGLLEKYVEGTDQIWIYTNGEEFLSGKQPFDLVFMDVYMEGLSGVETARRWRRRDGDACLVFTTTSPHHALEGFEVKAMHYLVKPVSEKEVQDVLARSKRQLTARPTLALIVDGQRRDVPLSMIRYAEVQGKGCRIHLVDGAADTVLPIKDLEALLPPPDFLRCHHSYIVNLAYVKDLDTDFLLDNGEVVYVRVRDLSAVRKAWRAYMADKLWEGEP